MARCEFNVKDGIETGSDGRSYITSACSCTGASEIKGKGFLLDNITGGMRNAVSGVITSGASIAQIPGEILQGRTPEEDRKYRAQREIRRTTRGYRQSARRLSARNARGGVMVHVASEPPPAGHHDKAIAELLGVPWIGETVETVPSPEPAPPAPVTEQGLGERIGTDIVDRIDSFKEYVEENVGTKHDYADLELYLPSCITGAWANARKLDVQWNGLASIEMIESVPGVKELDARHNNISSFPDLSRMPALERLDLRWNDNLPALSCAGKTYKNLKLNKNDVDAIRRCQATGTLAFTERGPRTIERIGEAIEEPLEILVEFFNYI